MKKSLNNHPPGWAVQLLNWYCRPELLEDLQGDLNEYFERNVKTKGLRRARLIYIIDVLKFFRPYTIRKPDFFNFLIHSLMLGSYIKTSGRSIARNKLFSAINIVGLSISMSVGLLIIAMLLDLFSYDKFHKKHDRIYRLISQKEYKGIKDNGFYATTSLKAAKTAKESITGIEDVAILQRGFSGDVTFQEKTIAFSGFWANESFFNVFSFQLIQGSPVAALKEPFSIILTETSARKIFGDVNVIGKTITLSQGKDEMSVKVKNRDYKITGILKDLPAFSHMKFEMLGFLSSKEVTEKDNPGEMAWDNMWSTWAYALIPGGTALSSVKQNLDQLSEKEDKAIPFIHIELDLQPLDNIMMGQNLSNQIGQTMGGLTVWILGSLAFIVILSACLNYTNLSIARSLRRSREIGIRKTIGALRGHVIKQFIVESVIISLLALAFSFVIFLLIRPQFLGIEQSVQELLTLHLSPLLIILFVLFAIIVGISAGIFPALFFSRINAVQVLKNMSPIAALKGVSLRKGLIVFQYCISIIAITSTLIIYKQYKHFIAYDLGFTTENILNIRLQGNNAGLLKKEILELPEVKAVSQSTVVTGIGHYWGTIMKSANAPLDSAGVNYNIIDENYLPLHDHKIIAGKNFTAGLSDHEVIVNQQVIKRFNIAGQNLEKAIGEMVEVDGKELMITGVIEDFEYGKADGWSSKEVILRYSGDQAEYLNVKVLSSDWPATVAAVEGIWKKIDKVHHLDAKFYDEQIEEAFRGLKASMKVGSFLAFLVICIASIGLLGMVVFTTETRLREVSIRKVFGASEKGLLYLLSKSFLWLLVIAAAISIPVTYLFFERLLLPEIANHVPVGFTELFSGVLAIMLIALLMIASQILKVARTNPARVLKVQ